MNNEIKVSIVIVSYKSDDVIVECLKSIEKYNNLEKTELEVIVVDNYLSPGSNLEKELLTNVKNEFGYDLIYIKNYVNGGFGQGNNLGVSKARGNVIMFLNPDTAFLEPFLNEMYVSIANNKNLIWGFTLVDKEGKLNNSYSIFPDFFYLYWLIAVVKRVFFRLPNIIRLLNRLIWPWGAAFAMSKSSFEDAGRFDENIFLCNEEPDLLKRIVSRKIYISPRKIIHLEGHGIPSSVQRHYEYLKSLTYYCNKYNLSNKAVFLYLIFVNKFRLLFNRSNENAKNMLTAMEYLKRGK